MPRFKMIALTNPIEGKEAEYHEWYNTKHIPEVCAFPSVTGAQRYQMAAPLRGDDGWQFMASYDIETDDIGAVLGAIGQASAAGKMTQSDASDLANTYAVVYT